MHKPFLVVLAIYLIATLFYLMRLVLGQRKLSAIALRIIILGALFQTVVLLVHVFVGDKPHVLTYLDFFQLSALSLADVFIFLCFTKKFFSGGPFFITLIDVFCLLSLTFENHFTEFQVPRGASYLYLHLVSIFLAISIFSMALVTAIMFLLSEHQIRRKNLSGIVAKFPPLAVLEDIHQKAIQLGFILLALVIVTGCGYAKLNTGHYISGEPKQILTFLTWLIFAALINLREYRGWQGRKGVMLSFAGFVTMLLAFTVGLK